MKPVVYLDMLFLLNFLINSVILYSTSIFLHKRISSLRLVFSAALGAVYSCVMFFPQISFLYTFLFKSIFLTFVSWLTFPSKVPLEILKNALVFRFTNCIFGGLMFLLIFATDFGTHMGSAVSNGEFYFNIKPSVLLLSTALSYLLMYTVSTVHRSQSQLAENIVTLTIRFGTNTVTEQALLDTGCSVADPVSGRAAVIISPDTAKKLFSKELLVNLEEGVIPDNLMSRYRPLPFFTVDNENCILHGFIPDEISIDGKTNNRSIIAISKTNLHINSDFSAILNPNILEYDISPTKVYQKQRKAVNTL